MKPTVDAERMVVADWEASLGVDATGWPPGSSRASSCTPTPMWGSGTPDNLQVVTHSPVEQCATIGPTHADMTYYTTESGAGVVATGTMLWTLALRGENECNGMGPRTVEFARTVTHTILAEMAAGPLGERYPSRGNLAEIDPPASTRTGTGGAVDEVG